MIIHAFLMKCLRPRKYPATSINYYCWRLGIKFCHFSTAQQSVNLSRHECLKLLALIQKLLRKNKFSCFTLHFKRELYGKKLLPPNFSEGANNFSHSFNVKKNTHDLLGKFNQHGSKKVHMPYEENMFSTHSFNISLLKSKRFVSQVLFSQPQRQRVQSRLEEPPKLLLHVL